MAYNEAPSYLPLTGGTVNGTLIATNITAKPTTITFTGTGTTLAVNTAYVVKVSGAPIAFTLPATSVVGDMIYITGAGPETWAINQNSGQSIRIGSAVSTTGVGGSVAGTNAFDQITLRCVTANTVWIATSVIGNITVI